MIERIQSRDCYQDAQWREISASKGDCWQDYGILSLHLCFQEHSGPSPCCVEGGTCPGQCNKLESPKLPTPEYKQFPVKQLHGDLTLTAAWCDHKYAKVALPQMVARALHWHVWVSGSSAWSKESPEASLNSVYKTLTFTAIRMSAGPGRSILKAQISLIWVISQISRQDYMWSIAMRSLGERQYWAHGSQLIHKSYGFITFA